VYTVDAIGQVSEPVDIRRTSVDGMEAAVLDASSAAATAAFSRRRKQSRPRQLASSVDSETSTDNQQGTDASAVSALRVDSLCRKYHF